MSQHSAKQWFKLEELFFSQVDQELLNKMRSEMATVETAEAIIRVTGITDEKLASEIAKINVTVDTLSAFRLAPLVAVAWADDRVESEERDVILAAAAQSGIAADDPAMEMLKNWTTQRPGPELLDTWCEYASALCRSLNEDNRIALRDQLVSQAHKVAEACGGILGFGSISPSEKATLERIEKAFA